MRPAISWTDLAGERVAVWGLGVEGRANVRKLRSLGIEPSIVDDNPEGIADEAALSSFGDGLDALLNATVVVKTPGISRQRPEIQRLEAAKVPVVGGLGLWMEGADRSRVLCITGTKGKSTSAMIAAHIATGLGQRVFVGGNLGTPPYDLDAPRDVDLWVIETSSYQATDIASSPPVTAVTSLYPDHIPWHGDTQTYYRDKLSLCNQPGARLTVASAESPLIVDNRELLAPQVDWVTADSWPNGWAEPLSLLGRHNLVNASIARSALAAMGIPGANDDELVHQACEGFRPLESRLQTISTIGGVGFVDDGLSTNVLPTIAALESFPNCRIALIAGGLDREIDYLPLAKALEERDVETLVLTVYSTGPKIQEAIESQPHRRTEAIPCTDLHDAVRRGHEWAQPDGVVLLSPAAASFDAFDDHQHRSRVFKDAIALLN